MTPLLSKSKFVGGWQCEKLAYLNQNHPRLATPYDASTLAAFASGTRFGELAREYWPSGILVTSPAFQHDRAVEWTRELLMDPGTDVIFEAGFTELDTRVRADAMIRNVTEGTWDMVEVKRSSSVKDVYDVDLAIQRAVLEAAGIAVGHTSLMLVDNTYILGKKGVDVTGLFKLVDRTAEVDELLPGVKELNDHLHNVISGDKEPAIEIGPHCEDPYDCRFFEYCSNDRPADWIRYLPGFGLGKTTEYERRGIRSMRQIPAEQKLSGLQQRAVDTTTASTIWASGDLESRLEALSYPLHCIDFETIGPAVPLYERTRPWQVIPFQWSCHTISQEADIAHEAFLASGEADPRREFAESLLRAVPGEGSVLVYSGYEKRVLNELKTLFPDLGPAIESLLSRFVDLLGLVKENYYHPGFKGSFSLKQVLPIMAPGLDYSDLVIAEGNSASASFVDIVEGRIDDSELDQLQADLLEYCKRDTEAMVRIWQTLVSLAKIVE